jgi:transcription antitermination factor NusG
MKSTRNWYAIYTKPRWEKKVDKVLREMNVISYCPLNKVRKKWSDRYKIVEEPLFKSYGFVYIEPGEMQQVRMVNGVVNFVYWNGKPAIVKDWEMDNIKRFLNEYESVDAVPLDLKLNSKVMINQGVMMGQEATVERILHNVIELRIETLGYKLVAKTEKTNVVPIE